MKARCIMRVDGVSTLGELMLPSLDSGGLNLTYIVRVPCKPQQEVLAYLLIQDEVGNPGPPADTAYTYAVTEGIMPVIHALRQQPVKGGVRLAWDQLPRKPYITGVLITRENQSQKIDTLATARALDTTYTDYSRMGAGEQFTYTARAVYKIANGLTQKIGASVTAASTEIAAPLPPKNLKAAHEGRDIRLSWEVADSSGLFACYVYRGTSPKNMHLLSGAVRGYQYVDTAEWLSGRTPYYYAVCAMNKRQDTSRLTDYVMITPNRAIEMAQPTGLKAGFINGRIALTWDDLRAHDQEVKAYVIQRQRGEEPAFHNIPLEFTGSAFAEDKDVARGGKYQYRVAAISTTNDTGLFSNAVYLSPARNPVPLMNDFYVRSTSEGVEVSWPSVQYNNRKAYAIYRRLVSETKFAKAGIAPVTAASFTDKAVNPGQTYVYAVAIITPDEQEGKQGNPKSIKHRAVSRATIIN